MGTPSVLKGLEYLGDQRDPEDKPESVGPEIVEKYGHLVPGTLGMALLPMRYGMALANLFGSGMKQRKIEAAAPRNTLSASINKFLNESGLNQYKQSGKMSVLQGSAAYKNKKKLDEIVRAVKNKYPGYTQMQYAAMFKPDNITRFMPSISVSAAKESHKQELFNPKTNPAWTTPEEMKKKHGKGKMNARYINGQLLAKAALHKAYDGPNYNPKELRAGKGSNLAVKYKSRRTDMTTEDFFKNVYSSIEDGTFLPATGATQEQPPAQEQPPTQERSLAENAFKGIGIGSAITRNVFNPKRLPRPDLGFGFQKLFSRQQY